MNQEIENKGSEILSSEERLQLATCYISEVLRTYKTFRKNKELFSRVHSVCDQCYAIRPKWNEKRIDYKNNVHDIVLCNHCHNELDEESKKYYRPVSYKRDHSGGLFVEVEEKKEMCASCCD